MSITFLRGTSGSGKSTYAKSRERLNPKRTVVISRDRIRAELVGEENLAKYFHLGMDIPLEDHVTSIEHERLRNAALDDIQIYDYKLDIIIDNLNIRRLYIQQYMDILRSMGYNTQELNVKDFIVPIEECAKRCAERDEFPISETIIRQQHAQLEKERWSLQEWFQETGQWKGEIGSPKAYHRPDFPITPYVPNPTLPKALICDLDGTLAHRAVVNIGTRIRMRGWYYDEEDVKTDTFDETVLCTVQALADKGIQLLFVSGRKEIARIPTEEWLDRRLGRSYRLFMRDPIKDIHDGYHNSDDRVKYRIFNENIRDSYDVMAVFDDRKRVIAMWEALGLKVFNVGRLDDEF